MIDRHFFTLPGTDLVDSVRNNEWSLSDFVNGVFDLIAFHVQNHGLTAIIVISVIAIILLLSLDATRHLTGLIVSNLIRAVISTGTNVAAFISLYVVKGTKDVFIAKLRHALRSIVRMFKEADHQ